MLEVGRFSLFNNGGFVACIKFVYMGDDGVEHEVTATESYPVLQTREASPGNCGVPDGAMVWLKVGVTAGYDNKSQRCFIYRASNQQVADFSISGTTLGNNLEFKGLRTPAPVAVQPMGMRSSDDQAEALYRSTVPALQPMMFKKFGGKLLDIVNAPVVAGPISVAAGQKLYDYLTPKKPPENPPGGGMPPVTSMLTPKFKLKSAFGDETAISDTEFAQLVPQGLIGEIVGNLITSLAPVASELTRVLVPMSTDEDEVRRSAQGLLDNMVDSLLPSVLPVIGKTAALLAQSMSESEQTTMASPQQAAQQPYVLPEAWRTAAQRNS